MITPKPHEMIGYTVSPAISFNLYILLNFCLLHHLYKIKISIIPLEKVIAQAGFLFKARPDGEKPVLKKPS